MKNIKLKSFCIQLVTGVLIIISSIQVHAQLTKEVIILQPQPLIADAGTDQTITNGNSTVLGATPAALYGNGGYTYSWQPTQYLNNPLIENPSANPTTTTLFTLIVTDQHGYTASDQINITVNPNNGVPTISQEKTIIVAPVSGNKFEIINKGNFIENCTIKVIATNGKILLHKKTDLGNTPFRFSLPAKGLYMVEVSNSEFSISKKIIF